MTAMMHVDHPTVFLVDSSRETQRVVARLAGRRKFGFQWFKTATDFLESVVPERTGCVILETQIRDMSGLELQEVLNLRAILLPLIFLTEHGDVRTAVRAVKAGALEFLEKPVPESDLNTAIQTAMDRQQQLTQEGQWRTIINSLPEEERELLSLLARGCSNREIARRLELSVRTVELRRSRAMKRLGAKSAVELLAIALRCDPGRELVASRF